MRTTPNEDRRGSGARDPQSGWSRARKNGLSARFFYLTTRLGLRTGEVYAISRDRIRDVPPTLIVDRAIQRGYKDRPAMLGSRKNHEVYTTALGRDVLEAIRWHVDHGYAGPKFLFRQDGTFPKLLDSHKRPLRTVQKALGLPLLSHHQIGRHSMASQAATAGQPIKAIQAQLGHRSAQSTEVYAHLGSSAQLRLVKALAPASPPHPILGQRGQGGQLGDRPPNAERRRCAPHAEQLSRNALRSGVPSSAMHGTPGGGSH